MTDTHKFWTKALRRERETARDRPLQWLFSRRAYLQVSKVDLQCGDWTIPFTAMKDAVIYEIESVYFVKGFLLEVKTDSEIFQFGLNPSKYWDGQLPFPVRRDKKTLSGLWLRRALLLAVIAYLLWSEFA